MQGRVLIIAGSDPSGGAGIQADIKTVTVLGGYAATAITALTVQNTMGVSAILNLDPDFVCAQIDAVLDDIGADAVKIGMIGDVVIARAVAAKLKACAGDIPVVLDPVLVATSGDPLSGDGVAAVLRRDFMGEVATVAAPNLMELAALAGTGPISTVDQMVEAGENIRREMPHLAILLKGGHLPDGDIVDVLLSQEGREDFRHKRIHTSSTHGTGCTLASALATGLAQGMTLSDAAARAIAYVQKALAGAPGLGAGHGPLNHNPDWKP